MTSYLGDQDSDSDIYKLKKVIATTRDTRSRHLREELGMKTKTITELMKQLETEGWVVKKGNRFEITASEAILSEWCD